MRLTPARNAAHMRSTATNRPKKTTLPPCLRKRYRPSFNFRSLRRTR